MTITVVAGQILTADNFNALVPKFIRKAADESVTSSTVLQNDNDFASISFGAGELWVCELMLTVTGATTGDISMAWAQTGGAAGSRRHCVGPGISATDASDGGFINVASRAFTATVSYGGVTSTTIRGSVIEKFNVETTTAGTITLTWAQRVSDAVATTVLADSYFVAHRVT